MKYLDLRENKNYIKIKEASDAIKKGGLVLFPTETVYGIGASGLDVRAIEKIFKAKTRAMDNPLILHISNISQVYDIAKDITDIELKLMEKFWPGPFTIILKRKDCVPNIITAGLDTVAVRMPSNKIAHELIKQVGIPIAAPSANISGRPSGTNIQDIFEELKDKVDYVIDGGDCEFGIESTVVKVENDVPIILRPGKITVEDILKVIGKVELDEHIFKVVEKDEKILSPGIKYKHYAPNTKCILVYSKDNNKMVNKINTLIKYNNSLVVCCNKNKNKYNSKNIIAIGKDKKEICKNIFKTLRKIDTYDVDLAIIEGVDKSGIGLAIMNRLIRACAYNYIEI